MEPHGRGGGSRDEEGEPELRVRRGDVDHGLATELVEEVLHTALALEDVITSLLAELPPDAFPGRDDPASVLMEMIVGSVQPAAAAAGVRDCRSAIALVGAIRERVLADLHTAAELAKHRD
jgi:hypothetical protein